MRIQTQTPVPLPLRLQPRAAVSRRSVTLGLLSTIFICSIAYYNDFAVNNTFLIGNNLPLGLVLMTFLFVLLVNGPLSRFAPRYALSSGELAVAFSMALVACALPSGGLMRWQAHAIVAPFWHAQRSHEWRELLMGLKLPDWLFPRFSSPDRSTWFNDPVVNGFLQRWTGDSLPPYAAWIRPAIVWGIPLFAAYGAVMCLTVIVRRQWVENERLPFPLAQIQLSVLEAPRPGRWFNTVFGNRIFWFGFAIIFFIHLWNGGARYFPRYFPPIPVNYNLNGVFSEVPFSYVDWSLKAATIYFTVVGVAYFLNSSISLSIWGLYLALQLYRVVEGRLSGDPSTPGMVDQRFGGILAFSFAIFWIGRKHWALVLAQAFRGERAGEPCGRYLSYPTAFWGLVLCLTVFVAWLMAAGCDAVGSILLVFMLLTLFMMTARLVAETGLIHSPALVPLYRPLHYLLLLGSAHRPSVESFYMTATWEATHYDLRETLAVYGSHSLRLADGTIFGERHERNERSQGRRLMVVLALALLVGYVFSWAGTLVTEYRYAATLDRQQTSPINYWGVNMPQWHALGGSTDYAKGTYIIRHNPAGNFAFGVAATGAMALLRLRYVWWPLHPIGYLILETYPGHTLWLSFLVGWIAKQLIVRFGGPRLYMNAKPFFLGIIVGESVAAGTWLVVSIVLNALGHLYVQVQVMPG